MARTTTNPEALEQRLKVARGLRRMTARELAQRSGLTPMAISHFECGRRAPSLRNLARLADALGVSTDFLLGRKDR